MEAPAGNVLYYTKTNENADLFRSSLDGAHEKLVLRGIARRGFVIADDRIYYLHQDADGSMSLRISLLRTGEDVVICNFLETIFLGLGLSPDGRNLLFTRVNIRSNLMLAEGIFW